MRKLRTVVIDTQLLNSLTVMKEDVPNLVTDLAADLETSKTTVSNAMAGFIIRPDIWDAATKKYLVWKKKVNASIENAKNAVA